MAKEILFSNGAIQNREFSLDEKPYKALGIAAARVLNEFAGNDAAFDIHCWNNVGTFDNQMSVSSDERLLSKYNSVFMQKHLRRWSLEKPNILCDDDVDFSKWALDVLGKSLENNTIYIEEAGFIYCKSCSVSIAEQCVNIENCPQCGSSTDLVIRHEEALFANRKADHTKILSYDQIFNKINLKHEINSLKQIPERLLLSRDRSRGVDLESIGLEHKRMDPRLGIGMLAVYAASVQGFKRAGLVQSISTLVRTVPYLNSTIPDPDAISVPDYSYAFYAKVDPDLLDYEWATPELLMLNALGQRNDITKINATKIEQERRSVIERIEYIQNIPAVKGAVSLGGLYEDMVAVSGQPDGNFTFALASLNKQLGRCMEYIKHNRQPSADELTAITSTMRRCDSLRRYL